jgi:hypothetical protein
MIPCTRIFTVTGYHYKLLVMVSENFKINRLSEYWKCMRTL